MKKVLFYLLAIVSLTASWACQNTNRYKIPKTNKVLLIYRPWFTGAAYITIRDSGATALMKSDVDVIRVPMYETTELYFVLELSDPDKIYCVDPWNIATLHLKQKKYKKSGLKTNDFINRDNRLPGSMYGLDLSRWA